MTAIEIHDVIVAAANHQIANSDLAKRIVAAGFGHDLGNLIVQIAANAANPLELAFEDAMRQALANVSPAQKAVR